MQQMRLEESAFDSSFMPIMHYTIYCLAWSIGPVAPLSPLTKGIFN